MIIRIAVPEDENGPVTVDSATLSDWDATYGIRRVDTEEVVVAAGTPLTLDGGFYVYDFTDAIDGVTYEAQFRLEYDGDVYTSQDIFTPGGTPGVQVTLRAAFVDADGALFEPDDTPELANPSGTYGVRKLDDATTVVESGEAMSLLGSGYYAASFFTEEPESRFRFYVHAVVDTVDFYLPSVTNGQCRSVALVLGRYTNSYRMGQFIGHDNLYLWAGTPQYGTAEADEPVDFAFRISQFIRDAENWLDAELLGAFVEEPWTESIPQHIIELATVLATVRLYESRGVDDVGEGTEGPAHRLSGAKKDALKTIRKIKMGLITLTDVGYGPANSEIDPGVDD